MTTEVVRRLSPEGEELAAKREELARLEALSSPASEPNLAAFEGLYLRLVGVLYAELDEWNGIIYRVHHGAEHRLRGAWA